MRQLSSVGGRFSRRSAALPKLLGDGVGGILSSNSRRAADLHVPSKTVASLATILLGKQVDQLHTLSFRADTSWHWKLITLIILIVACFLNDNNPLMQAKFERDEIASSIIILTFMRVMLWMASFVYGGDVVVSRRGIFRSYADTYLHSRIYWSEFPWQTVMQINIDDLSRSAQIVVKHGDGLLPFTNKFSISAKLLKGGQSWDDAVRLIEECAQPGVTVRHTP